MQGMTLDYSNGFRQLTLGETVHYFGPYFILTSLLSRSPGLSTHNFHDSLVYSRFNVLMCLHSPGIFKLAMLFSTIRAQPSPPFLITRF